MYGFTFENSRTGNFLSEVLILLFVVEKNLLSFFDCVCFGCRENYAAVVCVTKTLMRPAVTCHYSHVFSVLFGLLFGCCSVFTGAV